MTTNENKIGFGPKNGHYFCIVTFLLLLTLWLILLFAILFDLVYFDILPLGTITPMHIFALLFLMPLGIIGVYSRIGRHIILCENTISKPAILKRNIKYISNSEIGYFEVTPLGDCIITIRTGKKIIYRKKWMGKDAIDIVIKTLKEQSITERS